MARPRVLVGGFSMEANTFAPGETTLDDLRAQVFGVGGDVHAEFMGPESELAGAWSALEEEGFEPLPSLAAWAGPSRPLAAGVVDELMRLLFEPLDDSVAGAYLMLHGACVAHDEQDPEGRVLEELRTRLGPERPIVASLDCHAHLTPRMVAAADAFTAYRSCPHLDTRATGEQAGRLLAATLRGEVRPVTATASRPMITPPQLHDSSRDPFRRLMALNDEVEREGALASCLLPVQPWIDVDGLSWKAVVTADGDPAFARRAAERIISAAWAARHEFLAGSRPPVDEALEQALRGPAPYIVADAGDTTNGGAIGDSTELLRAALRRGGADVLLSVRDADAAAAATRAGEGAPIELELGLGGPGAYNERTRLRARVERLFDGEVVYTHPVNAGYRAATGPAALLRGPGGLQVVVHTRSVGVIDPALYRALGADPADAAVIQVKSHVSFKAAFDPITTRSVVAETPGPTTGDLVRLDYKRRPRPLYPFEDA
ncbi:MAG TPA: M81 family metallopeptidase [Gaiellaceae bacterium]|nr:M81 family metallopeptidase [Gaiellaceae bacterium]